MLATPNARIVKPTDERLIHTTWLYCWSTDPSGHCLCPRGSFHRTDQPGISYGGPLDCGSAPGKHPHPTFPHGAGDSIPYADLLEEFGPPTGQKRLGMCLQDVILFDIDSEHALQGFYRIRRHVPMDKIIGIAKTPRGWHLFLHCPEWTQIALNRAMKSWLAQTTWDGTDQGKISRRGIVLDVRTGTRRYVVWPGEGSRDRRWVGLTEFAAALQFAGQGMPSTRLITDGSLAPWNLHMNDELRERIARAGEDVSSKTALKLDGSEADLALAWRELERWAKMIEKMGPESGRNNSLNRTAYFSGVDAIKAGHPADKVEQRLLQAAQVSGTPGARATITSGLTSGLRNRYGNV